MLAAGPGRPVNRFKAALLASAAAVAALPLLAGPLIRAQATDAAQSRRLVPVRGHGRGQQDSRMYLDFDPAGFAAHPGRLSMRAASGGELIVLGPPVLEPPAAIHATPHRALPGQPLRGLRRAVERGDPARVLRDGKGQLSGHLGETPADFGFRYEDVQIGGLPAWVIPAEGPGDVWVIHVHGLGSSRSQCLRGVRAFSRLGYTSLLPSYRTSLDLPGRQRRSHLGVSEWTEIETARRYALACGARRIIFVGWSLGASIVARVLQESPDGSTAGALLVSPALDWPAIITAHLRKAGCPEFAARWLPSTVNILRPRGEPVIRWHQMPGVTMQSYPATPTMILHGSDDQSVPVELSRIFASRHLASVQLIEFAGAHHTLEWNSAPALWDEVVTAWCHSLGLAGEHSIEDFSEAK
ncbi:alpha/beta hydrolase [Arthrobacter sp. zg-Y750]|uniref:alpha/beta hydrolase n=1 Tax=Arthrobacter sp. zg-Y750 TaxID=2894189 RepID=UPI001E5A4B26|nr:alpha/beta fold hydrolase [Arthrobacter sp. zg-Y750]MCC9176842.1 alpha/beta fold hydrolase [Arthrobacter sp. zg-Y750]